MTPAPKVVVITGCGSGIGKATALAFAASGYRVFGGDLQFDTDTTKEFEHAKIVIDRCDVRDTSSLQRLIGAAAHSAGSIDVLVNNAGVGMVKQIDEVSEEDWQYVIDTNLKACFFGCKFAIEQMRKQEFGGSIVNIASNAGLLPRSHDPVYSISKQAVIGLTKSLALCHSKDRIRINAICPGPVERTTLIEENFEGRTDRQTVVRELIQASPLARSWDRMITPEEVANSALYLCDDVARMITGTAIAIDGGKSLGVPPQ